MRSQSRPEPSDLGGVTMRAMTEADAADLARRKPEPDTLSTLGQAKSLARLNGEAVAAEGGDPTYFRREERRVGRRYYVALACSMLRVRRLPLARPRERRPGAPRSRARRTQARSSRAGPDPGEPPGLAPGHRQGAAS
jgi:hypothetical protein